jgi:hypothetical protein
LAPKCPCPGGAAARGGSTWFLDTRRYEPYTFALRDAGGKGRGGKARRSPAYGPAGETDFEIIGPRKYKGKTPR